MLRNRTFSTGRAALLVAVGLSLAAVGEAQVSGPPSVTCHVTDGTFTACPNGQAEWADVQPIFFRVSNSYLYVNQDTTHTFLYLMYDFPNRTTALAPTESVRVTFDTVETDSGSPALVLYDISILGNSQISVLQNGQPTPPGRITGAAGFGVSPNSAIPHVMAELQVPLAAGLPPSSYSPDPLFWGAAPPPPPPPSPPPTPPPPPCPTTDSHTYNNCVKAELANAQANAANTAAVLGTAGAFCSLVATLGCGLLEPGLLALALVWQIASNEFGRKLALDPPGISFNLPPDPNFTVIAQPEPHTLTLPTSGMTPQEAAAVNAFAVNAQQFVALEQAETIALAREDGARLAGDAFWVDKQKQAALSFGSQAGALYAQLPGLMANIGTALQAAGVRFTIAPNDVLAFQTAISPTSPTSEVQQQFVQAQQLVVGQLGLSAADQALIVPTLLLVDPQAAATLGTGGFPQALSDPLIAASFQQLGAGLVGNAPSSVFLIGSDAVSFHRDTAFAAQLWAHLGSNVAYINDFGVSGAARIDGQPVTGFSSVPSSLAGITALFFASPHTCCNDPATQPSLGIAANASAITSFLAQGGVVVIEDFQGASAWDSILGFPSAAGVTYGAPSPGCSDPGVSTPDGIAAGFIGNGAGPNTYRDFCFVHQAYSDSFFAAQAFTSLIDAASLPSGSGVLLQKGLGGGTGTGPVTTATAAVVEATANGDTVVSLRGLNPTDAPTLQDQIEMIVQFRVIQNPSTDALQLTTQLVNSLPPSVLPPGGATDIINAVVNGLVPPPAVVSGMPGPGCSLWPPNGKLVQVATVTATDAVRGVLPGSFTVTGTSNEPSDDPSKPEIVITPNGSGGFVVQLEARRLGTGNGRIYTITATASNSVGFTTTATATCTVPHDQGH